MSQSSFSLRLETRTKYFAQLIASSNKQGLNAFIGNVLREYFELAAIEESGKLVSMFKLMDELWSEDEATRLALIGNRFPEALTERERILWQRIVCEGQVFWKVPLTGDPLSVNEETFRLDVWREVYPIWNGHTREELLIIANRFSRHRTTVPDWYTNTASIKALSEREAKFAEIAKQFESREQ
jgi:hypothetical protein